MAFKFSMLLEAVDRWSKPTGSAATSVDRLGQLAEKASGRVRKFDDQADRTSRTEGRLERATRPLAGHFDRAANGIQNLWRQATRADGPLGRLGRQLTGLHGRLVAFGRSEWGGRLASAAGWGIGTAVSLFAAFAAHVISVASKFEQYSASLTTVLGSQEAAQRAMEWVQKFSATTPYELDGVMDAFVRLRSYGIDPTDGTLRGLGDAASGLSKPLMAAVEMFADASQGEFERLKEFGIRASQQGNQVTFSFTRNGRDQQVTVRKTGEAIRKAILDILNTSYAGGMERQSRTFAGMLSNLADTWAGFELKVAKAGVFDFVKGKLEKLLTWLNEKAESGEMQAFAEKLAKGLVDAARGIQAFVTTVDWPKVARDLEILARALGSLADNAEKLRKVWGFLRPIANPLSRVTDMWDLGSGYVQFRRGEIGQDEVLRRLQRAGNYSDEQMADMQRRAAARGPVGPRPDRFSRQTPLPSSAPPGLPPDLQAQLNGVIRIQVDQEGRVIGVTGSSDQNDLTWRAFLGGAF